MNEENAIPAHQPTQAIRRKPVAKGGSKTTETDYIAESDPPPEYAPADPVEEGELRPDLDEQLEQLELETDDLPGGSILPGESLSENAAPASTETLQPQSKWKTAVGSALSEAKHFAGGLVSHPFEATKHYSVLRHSHGIVYYQGPTTSVAMTVFSDQPLPANRTLWLQKRGFSGKTGLKVGTLGSRGAWINVTPALRASPSVLPVADERAWQRDIQRFLSKAAGARSKALRGHRPAETDVVRIPHIAADGYFRIVVCADRKVLCPSPVFRYLSASTDPGHLRGASLTTLPLELGVKLGAFVARNAANRATQNALAPLQNALQPYEPGALTQFAAQQGYTASGAGAKVGYTLDEAGKQYDAKLAQMQESLREEARAERALAGGAGQDGDGDYDEPSAPYPIQFSGVVVKAPSSRDHPWSFRIPMAALSKVREDILLRLSGVYVAWVSLRKPKDAAKVVLQLEGVYGDWLPALIIVAPISGGTAKVVEAKSTSVHIIQDLSADKFYGTKLDVIVMAFLHDFSDLTVSEDSAVLEQIHAQDIAIVQALLSRDAWSAETVLQQVQMASRSRTMTERVADMRMSGQRQFDRVPLHKLGVKTNSMGFKDQLVGTGGICVPR